MHLRLGGGSTTETLGLDLGSVHADLAKRRDSVDEAAVVQHAELGAAYTKECEQTPDESDAKGLRERTNELLARALLLIDLRGLTLDLTSAGERAVNLTLLVQRGVLVAFETTVRGEEIAGNKRHKKGMKQTKRRRVKSATLKMLRG